ncbi:MAG: ECF transporter S component [Lachnospiraceae bacterium]|nr:ECF transporter S component [Lachnospiraceae bacterium]
MKSSTGKKVRYLTVTAMLAAVAFVLQFLEFVVPFMPGFIKLDLSDLPALIGAFAMGPVCGVLIECVKNLLHMSVSTTGGIGEICNFFMGACYVLPAGIIYKHHKTKKVAIEASFVGAISMAILSFPINYFVVYPFYITVFFGGDTETCVKMYQAIVPSVNELWQCLLFFNVPFTFVKGMVCVLITLLIYKRISPVLKGVRS